MKKQTAIQTAIENVDQCLNSEDVKAMLGELLEMEKQQIIDAFDDGYENGYMDNGKYGIDYYNKTYKNTKE